MKITKQQLKKIIKEELDAVIREAELEEVFEEGNSPEKAGIELVDQNLPDKVLKNPKVARGLASLQDKSKEEIEAMLSGGLKEGDGGMMAAQAKARQSALDHGRIMPDEIRFPKPEDPKTKAQKAKEIIVGSGAPIDGAIAGAIAGVLAVTATGLGMTPLALATWTVMSIAGWAHGKMIDRSARSDTGYSMARGFNDGR